METGRRKQTIVRYRPPGVTPLELWDLWVGFRILWECMQDETFPETLVDCLRALRRGEGATRSGGAVPREIAGFDSLFVSGGRSQDPRLRLALAAMNLPCGFAETPDFPAHREAAALLSERGAREPWICDLGQTSLKICSSTQQQTFGRDLARLPVRTDTAPDDPTAQRRELRAWLTACFRDFAQSDKLPDGIFFALPSRLDETGLAEGSSYIGMAGDAQLVPDVLEQAGVESSEVLVANDAELASLEAWRHPTVKACEKTLVLTIGFGVGATLVCHS